MKKLQDGYQAREKTHFDRLAETTGEIWWGSTTVSGRRRLDRRAELAADRLRAMSDPRVLELGCGTGTFSKHLLEQMPAVRLVSCDISFKAIQLAAQKCPDAGKVLWTAADLTAMPFPPSRFDSVVGNSILHHIEVDTVAKECLRVLKPGGLFFFFEPNMMNPQVAAEKNIRFVGKRLQNSEDETAFFRWSLSRRLERTGFSDVSVVPFDFLHPGIPEGLTEIADRIGRWLEKIPLIREISGSLLIQAVKPGRLQA
jgi:SAM-dependent methyltransferase